HQWAITWPPMGSFSWPLTAVKDLTGRLAENHKELAQLTEGLAPGLQSVAGLGPVTAAIITCAYSHHGRIRSEAAFAALGGVAPPGVLRQHDPAPAQQIRRPSAKPGLRRHRPHPHELRHRNQGLRGKEPGNRGNQTGEIRRNLKRYVCRSIFRQLQTIMA
ncbi:transposase, partial [Paenarthrobacter sp. PAE-2]